MHDESQRVGRKGMVRRAFGKSGKPAEVPANGRRFEDGSLMLPAPPARKRARAKQTDDEPASKPDRRLPAPPGSKARRR